MTQLVNIDGKLYGPDDATISVFDHAFLFGDSVYETMRTYRHKVFLLDDHMMRLENSARMLYLKIPLSIDELKGQILRTVNESSIPECYVRLIITRGVGKIGIDIESCKKPSYVILVQPLEPPAAHFYRDGVPITVVSIRRNDPGALNPRMKSSNLINNILAYREAREAGAFEGILCNSQGFITEATGSNIFVVLDHVLVTPPAEAGLLEGVTRRLVLDLASRKKIPAKERNITPEELTQAAECFLTSTTKAILPVRSIGNTELSPVPGPVTMQLMSAYDDFVDAC